MSNNALIIADGNNVIGKKRVKLGRAGLLFDRFLDRFFKKEKPASNNAFKGQWSDSPAWF